MTKRLASTRVPRQLRLRDFPLVGTIAIVGLLFLYLPMVITTVYAFNAGEQALVWQGFSFKWFLYILTNQAIIDVTVTSLQVAVLATVGATVFAIGFALGMERLHRAGVGLATTLLMAPLVIPEIVLAVATLGFIRLIGLAPGFTALVLAHLCFCIPFALMPIRSRLQTLGPDYFEAAADLGGTSWGIFRRVTLPLLMPGVVSGAILAFVISLDDFIISNFLSSAGSTTLPVYLFGLLRRGASPSINVIAVLLLVLAIAVTTITYLQTQRKKRK